jgi:hypothetical protein
MSQIVDKYNTDDDGGEAIGGSSNWKAQTWLATDSYSATSMKLKLHRDAGLATTTLTVSLRATSSGEPSGGDLTGSTTTMSTADITTSSPGTWYEFTFSSAVDIVNGTTYAIVARLTAQSGGWCRWRTDTTAGYTGGSDYDSTDGGSSWTPDASDDAMFEIYTVSYPAAEKVYSKQLVAIGNGEVWYESEAGTMSELSAANGDINVSNPLEAVNAYEKLFIANKSNLKVADFVNTKINTTDAGANPCTRGMTLTGGTSSASMRVDYVDGVTDDAAANIYGKRTTGQTFSSGETVTGTNGDGNAVSFVTSAAETAPPHWYSWTVFGQDTTTYGTMPSSSSLVALYRGRLVLNDTNNPHAWYMTKVGDPWKIKYDFTNDAELSAAVYSNNLVGELGDILTSFITYKDDLIIFGCQNSIWILIGDPLADGQLAQVTDTTGVWGPRSWCMDNEKNIYFLGNDGIYKMPVSETVSQPVNISKLKLPNLMTDLDLDKSLHRVVLAFDPIENGIVITRTLLDGGTNTGYFYSLTTDGYFPESYHANCGIFSAHYYPATDDTYKKMLFGGDDGYIREFDGATKNDATTSSTAAISSYCTIIQQMGEDESAKGLLKEFRSIMAGGASGGDFTDSDGVSWELHTGDDAETVLEDIKDGATAWTSGSWSTTGKQNKLRPRMRGSWAGIKLYNSTASETWALEKLFGDYVPRKGKS